MKPLSVSRRAFLRGSVGGAAVSLALPPLEAMLRATGARADAPSVDPFFGIFFWANGLPWNDKHGAGYGGREDLWTPAATGPGYAPSPLLMPLAHHPVSVVTGLQPHTDIPEVPGGQSDGHMRGFMVAITGDRPRPEGFDHASHTLTALRPSLDQVVARHPMFYSAPPRFRSLAVGVSEVRFHDYGHWNAISYNGPDSQNLPVMRPSELFDLLFAIPVDLGEMQGRQRVLDAVLADARALSRRLGVRDRQRLEDHLEHVHEIQRRFGAGAAGCDAPPRPSDAGDLLEKTTQMAELVALAVKCRLTRAFSFMLTSPATNHVFSNLGVPDGMHKTCHDGHWESVRDITAYHMQGFARFLDAFANVPLPEGGTLLDAACILGTSEYGEGWQHGVKEMPVVIAGRAGGALRPGVHVRDPEGNVSRGQLTVLRALGLPFDTFGFNGGETGSAITEIGG